MNAELGERDEQTPEDPGQQPSGHRWRGGVLGDERSHGAVQSWQRLGLPHRAELQRAALHTQHRFCRNPLLARSLGMHCHSLHSALCMVLEATCMASWPQFSQLGAGLWLCHAVVLVRQVARTFLVADTFFASLLSAI